MIAPGTIFFLKKKFPPEALVDGGRVLREYADGACRTPMPMFSGLDFISLGAVSTRRVLEPVKATEQASQLTDGSEGWMS